MKASSKKLKHRHDDFPECQMDDKRVLAFIYILFFCYLILSIIASFYPESFLWGINHLAFLQLSTRFVLVISALIVMTSFISAKVYDFAEKKLVIPAPKILKVISIVLIGIGGSLLFYHFRILTDMYGDSRTLLSLLAGKHYGLADLFSFDDNEPLSRLLHQSIADYFHSDLKTTFQIVSSACGGIFLVIISFFTINLSHSTPVKILAAVFLLTCGTNQLFFGHVEDYTVVYLAIVLFLIFAWKNFEGGRTLGLMAVVFLIGLRLHMEMVLLLPAFLYAVAYRLKDKFPLLKPWIEPRRIIAMVAFSLVCAAAVYFFLFKAYKLSTDTQAERSSKIFLPLLNPLPEPHSYALLTLNHFSDVLQEFLITVSPGALIVICLGGLYWRRVQWKKPPIIFFALASFYFILFDFTVNPLLTMPRDWDFLSLAAASITFFALALAVNLLKSIGTDSVRRALLGIAFGAAIVSCSIFYINSDTIKAGHRLRSLGVWAYRSYYWGSSYMINVGTNSMGNIDDEIRERKRVIENLLPYRSPNDLEISILFQKLGYADCLKKDYQNARECFGNAIRNCNTNTEVLKLLALAYLKTWQFDAASDIIDQYNDLVNDPEITEPSGLTMAEYTHYLTYLASQVRDSTDIQGRLDDIQIGQR